MNQLTIAMTLAAALAQVPVNPPTIPPPAQPSIPVPSARPSAVDSPRWVVPQMSRAIGQPAITVTGVDARIAINGATASTTLDIAIANRSGRPEQAVLLVPVPADAVVTGFAFEGPASEPTAKLLPRDEARRIYDQIVSRERDPALLEWAGWNMLRSSVFPVPAHGTQRLRISWEALPQRVGTRLDYLLPRSEIPGAPPWTIEVTVNGSDVAAAYSPSHEITIERLASVAASTGAGSSVAAGGGLRVTSRPASPGAFRLSVVRTTTPSASVMTYPDPASGGGYFLLLAAAPDMGAGGSMQREVTVVIDRSGSLAGAPFERAKAAALRVLDELGPNDRANVIDFSNSVSKFANACTTLDASMRSRLREHVAGLRTGGGTNIHDALLEALRQPSPGDGFVSTVLFVTDGVPTIGRTTERAIRDMAEHGNAGHRRIFTVGLGTDVNVPLLDRISDASRASSLYLAMDDDLPARVAEFSDRLRGPVLADLSLAANDTGRVADLQPARLPDLFRNGTLVVLGHYRGDAPFRITLQGRGAAGERAIEVDVDPKQASTAHAFVPRLWASRRIAQLVDEVRQQGLDGAQVSFEDPKLRELVSEIVRLSTTWGVLTEYTSMLALEGSNLNDWRALEKGCREALSGRAVPMRVGPAAVSQGDNFNRQKLEAAQSATRGFVADGGAKVEAQAMNQCNDRTFYKSGNTWSDARLAGQAEVNIDEQIFWGSPRHQQVLWELVDEGRQSSMAMEGEIVLQHRGKTLRICNDRTEP